LIDFRAIPIDCIWMYDHPQPVDKLSRFYGNGVHALKTHAI